MRKFALITLLALAAAFVLPAGAGAYPLTVTGTASPFGATYTPLGGGLSSIDVLYTFRVIDDNGSGYGMNYLTLEFERDVFNSINSIAVASPGTWSILGSASGPNILYEFAGGSAGDAMLGDAVEILSNVTFYDEALTTDTLWNEGGVWEQAFYGISSPWGIFGGSTAVTPEPGTLLLLGSGLLGARYYMRKKKTTRRKRS